MHTGKKVFLLLPLTTAHAHLSISKMIHQQVSKAKCLLPLNTLFTMSLQKSRQPEPDYQWSLKQIQTEGKIICLFTSTFRNYVSWGLDWCWFMTPDLLIQHLWLTAGSCLLNSNGISARPTWKTSSHPFHGIYPFRGSRLASKVFSHIIKLFDNMGQFSLSFRKA